MRVGDTFLLADKYKDVDEHFWVVADSLDVPIEIEDLLAAQGLVSY